MRVAVATWWSLASFAIVACKSPSSARAPQDAGVSARSSATVVDGGNCTSTSVCPEDQYCSYAPGLCGKGRRPGTCVPKPALCGEVYAPVCGCDGKTYESRCAANAAGVDLAVMGGCKEQIPDWAPCGSRYCDARTSYCEIFLSDVFELPTDYFCRPLPPACLPVDGAARNCNCVPAGTRCLGFCGPLPTAPNATSGFHLTCQGTLPPAE